MQLTCMKMLRRVNVIIRTNDRAVYTLWVKNKTPWLTVYYDLAVPQVKDGSINNNNNKTTIYKAQ